MNKKFLILTVLTIFLVGMLCAYAVEPVDAKPIVKIKKHKTYYTAKFKYKGKTYKAKLKKNKKDSKMYGEKIYDTTKKKGGSKFRLFYTKNPDDWSKKGWNFCKLRASSGDSHLYYKIKWVK
ncbi:MAG: hypothetical protein IJ258_07010 [Methanobrevibacter sp.]|uniref:hypothetical protein n=1 Tax=Methanobrevibacter sp. TaxID=66852 RepID=UPI0025D4D419|nr:hypothetical protein [Methanobrevibacter sp.]MBQ8017841.1 hypothetical protein [Methanobrevibacter sp.]